ncbi:FAD-binding domain-containing protein [Lipomyces tetrasporus]|uniref:ferric-chelate reductase (NADPH) n=1 Tax=Lipomyces tetrasporus TaxID=54092 RepID=A0AAD7QQA8_9ASCO|nr:FAD-binding domain-containing protein [Lipomyces tetrasporus]KAJ8099597.1 FAD-binding domain-containing protein [Lipomyces tetrasporus]
MARYNFANMGEGRFNPDGSPRPGYLAKMYWAVIGGFLCIALLLRIFDVGLALHRKRSLNARPRFVLARLHATFTSIARVVTYLTPPFLQRYPGFIYFPSVGRMLLVLSYFGLLIGLFFYRNPINNPRSWENAAYRAGWLTIAQLPLLVLLSVKRLSVISLITGSTSSVTLNFFHRWVARGLLLTATLHMFYTMRYYASFEFLVLQLKTDIITRRGVGTWSVMAWIVVLTSIRPIRHYAFELFFANHVISIIAFFIVVMKHTPSYAHVYIWIAIGIWIADVTSRWVLILANNASASGLRYRASVSVMQDERALTVEIPMTASVGLLKWTPSQFVRLSFPTVAPFMSHPFTISSLPQDNKMQFVIRAKSGFTKRMLKKTRSIGADMEKHDDNLAATATYPVIIDGPYGGPSRSWNQFHAVLSVVCGVGATYGFSVLRDVCRDNRAVRSLQLVWIVRNYCDIFAFHDHLEQIVKARDADTASDLSVLIQVFVSDSTTIPAVGQSDLDSFLARHGDVIQLIPGKPAIRELIRGVLGGAEGETGIAVCGSQKLAADVKNDVAVLLDARAAHTGSGAQGCWVHVEQFEA